MVERTEGRYSKVTRRIWNDARFRRLSPAKPNGQTLFLRLLTGPELGCIPGLFPMRAAGLAEALGWSQKGFDKAFREVLGEGLAKFDKAAGLVWLPNAIRHNEPTSPNVVRSWALAWRELPESPIKDEAAAGLAAWAESKGATWVKAMVEALGKSFANPSGYDPPKPSRKPSRKPSPHPSPNQEQEQEQKQDQDQDPKAAEADPRPPAGSDPTPSGVQQRQRLEESLDEPEVAERPSRPRNREQALQVPIRERAQVLVDEEHLEIWLEPHKWPEVVELGERFATALGWTRPRLMRALDARRLVHLLAAFDAAELDRAVEAAPSDDWLTTGRKGLGSLSVEVVSRLLAPKRVAKTRRAPPSADEDPERLESGLRGLALLYGKPYQEVGT